MELNNKIVEELLKFYFLLTVGVDLYIFQRYLKPGRRYAFCQLLELTT